MRIRTPKLLDPRVIRNEIDALKARIGELRTLLPLAEVQHLRKSLRPIAARRQAAKAIAR